MEFKRRNPAGRTFSGNGFKIVRPTGPKLTRDGLALRHADHDYEVRIQGAEIWLLDDEREVGYAAGRSESWKLFFGAREFTIVQPNQGQNNSALMFGESRLGEIDGAGFPLRSVALTLRAELNDEEIAFIAMVAMLGWREADRSFFKSLESIDDETASGPSGMS